MKTPSTCRLIATLALTLAPVAAAIGAEMPRIVEKDGRHALYVDGAPFLILGGQCGNSSAWPAEMAGVWSAIGRMHANTLEAPIYWEQFEPSQGKFDTSSVDLLIRQAREHGVRLDLLWFGTWKNGSSHYEPLWMKEHQDLYPRIVGKTGVPVDSPSPHAAATLEADKRAFRALMRHLKAVDAAHTVILVQVENESGAWDTIRDYSPAAEALFHKPVPQELLGALGLSAKRGGDWPAVFGVDADEYFQAWSVAHFVGQVAAAGKEEYPLPMYANAALRDPISPGPAGTYESGGPTDNVLSIWRAAAPAIDVLAPDIYQPDEAHYRKVLDLYARPDNPLFVPETGGYGWQAHMVFAAIGKGAVGWSPFGVDRPIDPNWKVQDDPLAALGLNYEIVGAVMRETARLNFEGRLQACAEAKGEPVETLTFGPWIAKVSYGVAHFGFNKEPKGNTEPIGGAIVGMLGENDFLVTGRSCRIDFQPASGSPPLHREYMRVEEGRYENGTFTSIRIWNGDQTDYGLNFGTTQAALRVRLRTF